MSASFSAEADRPPTTNAASASATADDVGDGDAAERLAASRLRIRQALYSHAHPVPSPSLFALSNLWMARKKLMAMTGVVRPQTA